MGDCIFFPSVNWWNSSSVAVAKDGTLIYGSPVKSVTLLEPIFKYKDTLIKNNGFKLHTLSHPHGDRVGCIDINPEWPIKKTFVTSALDGFVKQWEVITNADEAEYKFKAINAHNIFANEEEEIIGTQYASLSDIISLGCNGTIVRWNILANVAKRNKTLLKSFRPTALACSPHDSNRIAVGTKQGVLFVLNLEGFPHKWKIIYKVRGHNDEVVAVSWCPKLKVVLTRDTANQIKSITDDKEFGKAKTNVTNCENVGLCSPNKSKDQDGSDESVQEEDFFDVYKEPDFEEFGHKKYQPENVIVKVKLKSEESDFLSDCMKLKKDIVELKENDGSLEDLASDLDNVSLNGMVGKISKQLEAGDASEGSTEVSTHRFLLASCGKQSNVCVWDESGKMLSSTTIQQHKSKMMNKNTWSGALNWMKDDVIIMGDGNSQIFEGNPLKIDFKNKFYYTPLHSVHKKGLFGIQTTAEKVQQEDNDDIMIWSVAQDRSMVLYSYKDKKVIGSYSTFGGFVYQIAQCPYDANKFAIASGDGNIRIWELEQDNDGRISNGTVFTQNVKGRILNVAWHHSKENLLAFSTAEGRIGLIDVNGKTAKSVRLLRMVFGHSVYSLSWGNNNDLYSCGGNHLVKYNTANIDEDPAMIEFVHDNIKWNLTECAWSERFLCIGNSLGAVAVTTHQYQIIAAAMPFVKLIQCIVWHPQSISTIGDSKSRYRNWFAVVSPDIDIAIMNLKDDNGKFVIENVINLQGHLSNIFRLSWSPHCDNLLLSFSQDTTLRVWDCRKGECIHSMCGENGAVLCGAWWPSDSKYVLSGSLTCNIRLWDITQYPAVATSARSRKDKVKHHKYNPEMADSRTKLQRYQDGKLTKNEDINDDIYTLNGKNIENSSCTDNLAVSVDSSKINKSYLLPLISKAQNSCSIKGCQQLLVKKGILSDEFEEINLDFLNIFGNLDDVNKLLDAEQEYQMSANNVEAWSSLGLLRGDVERTLRTVTCKNALTPFLLALAPSVSHKFWKDAIQLYMQQSERLSTSSKTQRTSTHHYGGSAICNALCQLSLHDIDGAQQTLCNNSLYREAVVALASRCLPTEQVLKEWAKYASNSGNYTLAAECYIALDEYADAAMILSKSNVCEHLELALKLAKHVRIESLTEYLTTKIQNIPENLTHFDESLPQLETIADKLVAMSINKEKNSNTKEILNEEMK